MDNRATRRREKRTRDEYVKQIDKLNPTQIRIMEVLATKKAEDMMGEMAKVINSCYYKALRKNRVGEDRAQKILDDTEVFINEMARGDDNNEHIK